MLSEIGQLQGHINAAGFYFREVPKGLNPQGQKQWGSPWTGGRNGKWLLLTGHRVSVLPDGKVPQFACTAM